MIAFVVGEYHFVATVLTVYGIETLPVPYRIFAIFNVATVLTVYGIETVCIDIVFFVYIKVATVLTVYGIETLIIMCKRKL